MNTFPREMRYETIHGITCRHFHWYHGRPRHFRQYHGRPSGGTEWPSPGLLFEKTTPDCRYCGYSLLNTLIGTERCFRWFMQPRYM